MKNDYLDKLNPEQRLAVETTEGPLMVIAGAGSGKTRVLTYRIAHLMQKGVDSFQILALTFTNKAAKEMKQRISKVVGESEARNLWMGTFHSVFARILRVEAHRIGFPSNFTIYDQQDALNVMKKVINELQLDKEIYKPKQVLYRISQFKNNLITVRAYFNQSELIEADTSAMRPKMGDIYRTYVDKCFKSGAMDFDDLLLRTNEILTRFPEVLAKYQDRFRYILVDEYQDTNHSQYLIVKALASRYENLCVVGDDAQSIYAFRGANIRNILSFKSDYPDAKAYALEQNYRSTKTIVKAANQIISQNKDQLEKNVWTANGTGEKIPVYRALTDADEASYIASQIFDKRMNDQSDFSDFAILYRTNAQSRAIEEALRKKNIVYRVFGGISFYQRKEVKDLIAYLRLIVNPTDEEALLRIINFPTRGIGQTTINKLLVAANEKNITIAELLKRIHSFATFIKINQGTATKLSNFHTLLESFRVFHQTNDVYETTSYIAKKSGILKQLGEDDTPEGVSRMENIQELLNSIHGFVEEQKQLDDGDTSLGSFLENIALATDSEQDQENKNKVSLMTIHLAKGLEFPNVFVVGLEEGLFPSMMSMNTRQELEEERRLFYVALTRAEKQAYFTYSVSRFRWGKIVDSESSRFLDEIDESCLEWKNLLPEKMVNMSGLNTGLFVDSPQKPKRKSLSPTINKAQTPKNLTSLKNVKVANNNSETLSLNLDDVVIHERFGKGFVKFLEGKSGDTKATILFDNVGEKKLLLKFAKLKILK